jgi:predicted dehydrogenase
MRRSSVLTAGAVALSGGAISANEKVRLGLIGCGGMGRAHAYSLAKNENCNVAAVCDVFLERVEKVATDLETINGSRPDTYQDFRKILDRNDIDAVFIASPDHWHAMMAIMACQAGKDVYVEKPVSTTVHEGRAMVNAARRYDRVMQVGTQHRSMPVFREVVERIRKGELGDITSATAWIGTNSTPVRENVEPVPDGLDWDLWLGPAPKVPFSRSRFGNFRAWHDYARGGELTNWGVHLVDTLHWGIGHDMPLSIQALGGSYRNGAGADNYETVDALLEYPGCTVTWEQRHVNHYSKKNYGMKFQGTDGRVECNRGIMTLTRKGGGVEEMTFPPEVTWADTNHHNNFFQCIRTRETPVADIDQGVRGTNAVLLAGIALKTGRKLEWDGIRETFVGDEQANRHLTRTYRPPWRL